MGTREATGRAGKGVAASPEKKGVFVKVPLELHRQLKAEAALAGKDLGDFAEELIGVGLRYWPNLKVVNGGHGEA
jgi:hypothetical protein